MKKRFLFVLALLSVLTITGCKDDENKKGTLSSPQEIIVQSDGDRSLIIFDEVKDAEYYNIYINDICITVKANGTGTIQFDASKIITLPQKYTIKVKAGSNNHFDSVFTDEYEYNHTSILDAPVISIDGTILNWNKVANAEFYDVVVVSSNPSIETTHRFPTNRFDFSNILANKGEYLFKVRAVSESGEYLSSIYSNQVKYIHTQQLVTPYNLHAGYDINSGEMLLSFVSSENVDNFTVNINGTNYTFAEYEMSQFIYQEDIGNMYVIELSSFAKYKGLEINNSTILSVSLKANSSNTYLTSSEFSNKIDCQFVSILESPTFSISTTNTTCKITISATNSQYLSGFVVYLNNKKYKTVGKDITEINVPKDDIGSAGIRVQAISNNNNCYASSLSEVKYLNNSLPVLPAINASYSDGMLVWESVTNASSYYVEIKNNVYRYGQFVEGATSLDISELCLPGKYNIVITAMGDGYRQVSKNLNNTDCSIKLSAVENVEIATVGDGTYLYFTKDANAYGYLMYLNDTLVPTLFTQSPINLNAYISEANSYKLKIKAVGAINQAVVESPLSTEQQIESVKTLSAPALNISKVGEKYYLEVAVDEAENAASNYEIWITYQSIGELPFQPAQIDITSYFTNAGQYTFMIKAKAKDSPYIKDSDMASITYNCIKQLDTVTDIKVTKLEDESKYILTFNEQTLAAKYLVRIVKADSQDEDFEFEVSRGVVDIGQHVIANGVYRVYVQALALDGGFYTDSATSGNPYRLVKGETLPMVENINITKDVDRNSIQLTWDSVENSSGYQVYIYYNNLGQNLLKKSIFVSQTQTPGLEIGSGEYACLNKEGDYLVNIKALGDNEAYETSQTAFYPYSYVMENIVDFERNTIFMYGEKYAYKISDVDNLKNLLYYHYLYNEQMWKYNTLGDYNLKVYCDISLDDLANEISANIANQVESVDTNAEKMTIIATALLGQYPEMSNITLGYQNENVTQSFCLNPTSNIFIFRYQDTLDKNKTQTISTTNKVYGEKLTVVDTFDQRSSTYVFAIDTQESVDVTTTEQLFMALQYNKKPNFVGDCEVAKAVYENARFILRQICSDTMTEYEKTLQIYDFLTKRISLNNEAVLSENKDNLKELYLEGILYNSLEENGLFTSVDDLIGLTATSEGLSKVFVVLCSIEGIDSIKVNGQITVEGTQTTTDYAWNKVYIDIDSQDNESKKEWFVVDLANAIKDSMTVTIGAISESYQVAMHKYFLIQDSTLAKAGIQSTTIHKRLGDSTDYVASTEYDYYSSQRFSCVHNSQTIVSDADFRVSNVNDVADALIYAGLKAGKKGKFMVDVDAKDYIFNAGGTANAELNILQSAYEIAKTKLGYQFNLNFKIFDERYIIFAIEPIK